MTIRRAIATVMRAWADELDPKPQPPTHPGVREVEKMLAERTREVGESLASARVRRAIDEAQGKVYPINRKRALRALR